MKDETLRKILVLNARSAGGFINPTAAFDGNTMTEARRIQVRRVLDSLLVGGQAKKTAAGSYFLTTSAMSQKSDLSNLTMDPAPVNLKAIPSTFDHD